MQNLGLSQDYKDSESAIGKWLKQSFGLHFLDPTEVEDCFVEEYKNGVHRKLKINMDQIWL
jgi:hypothetical protein